MGCEHYQSISKPFKIRVLNPAPREPISSRMQDKRWYTRTLPIISQPFRTWVFDSRKLPYQVMDKKWCIASTYLSINRDRFGLNRATGVLEDTGWKVMFIINQLTRQPGALDLTEISNQSRLQDTGWYIPQLPHPAMVFGPSRATRSFKAAGYKLKHVTRPSVNPSGHGLWTQS
jgi:hypothetical protein